MRFKYAAAASALAMAAVVATQAGAQAGAQPPQLAPLPGPAPAGICTFDMRGMLAASAAGHYLEERIKELKGVVAGELSAEGTALQSDRAAIEAQKATMPADQLQSRATDWQNRAQALQQKQDLRNAELEQTFNLGVSKIKIATGPLARQVAVERRCTLLLDAESLVLPTDGTDITSTVLTRLNATLTQFPLERVHLDQQTQGGQ